MKKPKAWRQRKWRLAFGYPCKKSALPNAEPSEDAGGLFDFLQRANRKLIVEILSLAPFAAGGFKQRTIFHKQLGDLALQSRSGIVDYLGTYTQDLLDLRGGITFGEEDATAYPKRSTALSAPCRSANHLHPFDEIPRLSGVSFKNSIRYGSRRSLRCCVEKWLRLMSCFPLWCSASQCLDLS